jgi:subtilisin-like proprotein convertase family protein
MFKRLLTGGAIALGVLALVGSSANADVLNQRDTLNGTPLTITDVTMSGFVTSIPRTINVVENEVIQDISVTIEGLQHSWAGDLVATLRKVDGTGTPIPGLSATLFSRISANFSDPSDPSTGDGPGNSSNFGGGYTFSTFNPLNTNNPASIWSAADDQNENEAIVTSFAGQQFTASNFSETVDNAYIASGVNESVVPLADIFGGESTAGAWEFRIEDRLRNNEGSFTGVTLNFNSGVAVPEPGSIGLLALGTVGGFFYLRRRKKNEEEAVDEAA